MKLLEGVRAATPLRATRRSIARSGYGGSRGGPSVPAIQNSVHSRRVADLARAAAQRHQLAPRRRTRNTA